MSSYFLIKKTVSTYLVNPQVEIPKEVIEIHGITNEKVKNAPSFNEIGKEIKSLIENCDLAGLIQINLMFLSWLKNF